MASSSGSRRNRRNSNSRRRSTERSTGSSLPPKVQIDGTNPPLEIRKWIVGELKDPSVYESDSLQSIIWEDDEGKKLLLKKKPGRQDFYNQINPIVGGILNTESGLESSTQLIVQLGPNDSIDVVKEKLDSIRSGLGERVVFIGGFGFQSLKHDLEKANLKREQNQDYGAILKLLDKAIALEKGQSTVLVLSEQIDVINQIIGLVPGAGSSNALLKDKVDNSLEQLKSGLEIIARPLINQREALRITSSQIRTLGEAHRTPVEVLVHLLYEAQAASSIDKESKVLKNLVRNIKSKILRHNLTLSATREFLRGIRESLRKDNQFKLAQLTEILDKHLPKSETELQPNRLHDNIYGRVFDSAIASELVNNPPEGILRSVKEAAKAMAEWMEKPLTFNGQELSAEDSKGLWVSLAKAIRKVLREEDSRFWFPLVPQLNDVASAKNDEETLEALKTFLNNPGENGQALIAIPYILVKITLKAPLSEMVPWKKEGDKNFREFIEPQKGVTKSRIRQTPTIGQDPAENFDIESKGSGITLLSQGNPFVNEDEDKSVKPAHLNLPDFNAGEQGLNFPNTSVQTALEHGLPLASGVSGSTNIMLYIVDWMNKNRDQFTIDPISTKDLLLGTMMFLVYDGGHSIQEVLWTANQVDGQLNLKLNLQRPDSFNSFKTFVADYEQFGKLYNYDIRKALENAMEKAFEQTIDYFKDKSVYSPERGHAETTTGLDPALRPMPENEFAMGDLNAPNPALYRIPNKGEGYNYAVHSLRLGGNWMEVDQFSAVLAVHWLATGQKESLKFSDLSKYQRDKAVKTLIQWNGNGLPARIQYAREQLDGEHFSDSASAIRAVQFAPANTQMWLGNDTYARAAVKLRNGDYRVYDPDTGRAIAVKWEQFRDLSRGFTAFVVKKG